jgi:hypothetical protein
MDGTEDIFNKDFLNDALQAARKLVDSGDKFRKLVGDTFSRFNDDLMSNTRSIGKLFDDIHADHDQFEKFDVTRRSAENKLNQIYRQREKALERLSEIQENVLPNLQEEFDTHRDIYRNAVMTSNAIKSQISDKKQMIDLLVKEAQARGNDDKKDKAINAIRREYNELAKKRSLHDDIAASAKREYVKSRQQVTATKEVERNMTGSLKTLDSLDGQMTGYVDKWKQASRQLGWIDAGMRALSKIPGLNELFNAEEVLENMRKSTLMGKGFFDSVKSGLSALPKNIPWLLAIDLAIKALTKLFDLWIGSDKYLTRISRQFSVVKDDAEGIVSEYAAMIPHLQTQYATIEHILTAQEKLNSLSIRSFRSSSEMIDAQIQLTKEYNLSDEAALGITRTLQLNNEEGTKGLDVVRKTARQYMANNKVLIRTEALLQKMAGVSSTIRNRFNGSTSALAKAVLQADKLGVSLDQAKKSSSTLLDFQSSIENELEAELLLNKSLNFERARAKALNRDFLGATEDILKQLGDYDALSKMNTIQLEAAAKAAGMTSDELIDAAAQQKFLVGEAKKYHAQLKQGSTEAENFRKALTMNEGDFDKTTRQITAQEKLSIAMEKVQDLFTSLVADGTIDKLASMINRLADAFIRVFGEDNNEIIRRTTNQIAGLNAELKSAKGAEAEDIKNKISQLQRDQQEAVIKDSDAYKAVAGKGGVGVGFAKAGIEKIYDLIFNKPQQDFISRGNQITPFRKDDLIIGGTKLLNSSNNSEQGELLGVMKELLATVKSGGKVIMDGKQVGYTQLMGAYNSY